MERGKSKKVRIKEVEIEKIKKKKIGGSEAVGGGKNEKLALEHSVAC